MEILSLDEIVKAFCGQIISGDTDIKIRGISTDSRTVKPGDLFFALKGERCDGHQFVLHAMNTGAVGPGNSGKRHHYGVRRSGKILSSKIEYNDYRHYRK